MKTQDLKKCTNEGRKFETRPRNVIFYGQR